jgi:hypothetical protein
MEDDIIPAAQIERMTGYVLPCKQLDALHQRGFVRAYRNRRGVVILEKSHYDAVTRGQFGAQATARPAVNVAFLRKAAA